MASFMVPLKIGYKMAASATVDLSKSSLDLGTGSDGVGHMMNLGHLLRTNTTCTSLTLNDNIISAEGATGLFGGLKVNRTLEELYLSKCTMHSLAGNGWSGLRADGSPIQYDTSGMPALIDALKENRTLKTLYLDGNLMSAECATHLAEALKVNGTLEKLSLCFCFPDTDDSAGSLRALAEALTVNRTLKTLILRDNRSLDGFKGFRAEGLTHLAEALKVNQGLTRLDLSCDFIDDEGALTFVEALKVNRTLTNLELSNNKIKNPETVKALVAAAAAATDRPNAVDVTFFGAFALQQSARRRFDSPFASRVGNGGSPGCCGGGDECCRCVLQ
jgi:hypothetical protein